MSEVGKLRRLVEGQDFFYKYSLDYEDPLIYQIDFPLRARRALIRSGKIRLSQFLETSEIGLILLEPMSHTIYEDLLDMKKKYSYRLEPVTREMLKSYKKPPIKRPIFSQAFVDRPLEEMSFNIKQLNHFRKLGIKSLKELLSKSPDELVGQGRINELDLRKFHQIKEDYEDYILGYK